MMNDFGIFTLLLTSVTIVAGHGQVASIQVGGKAYSAWQVFSDPFTTPAPIRFTRAMKDNGPVPDFTTKDIVCGAGGNPSAGGTIELKSGDKVTFQWTAWSYAHSGPVMTYIAKCTNDNCNTFKGDTGAMWVKIDQLAFNMNATRQWAGDFLHEQGDKWTITIPPQLAPGEYLLRHEILALHSAGTRMGAQFYPNCAQIRITSGGTTQLPAGISLPGAYNPADNKGILVELWKVNAGQTSYTAPGGSVWSGAVPNVNRAGP